jgi:hypothetical protein
MREISKLVALAGGIAFAASMAYGANQTILGKALTVKDPSAGADPAKRSIKGSAKEKASSAPLSADPTLAGSAGGAFLDIFANGNTPATSTAQEFSLPQKVSSTGQPFWSKIGSTGFRYKDAKGEQGPVKSVLIKKSASGAFSIKVKLTGKSGTINVIPPDPGVSGCMALKIPQAVASGDRYSVQFGVESKIKNVDAKVFSAKKPTNKGICPTVVTTSTTTTTTHATTSSTSSSTTTTHATTTTTMYGSPSRAFLEKVEGLLD